MKKKYIISGLLGVSLFTVALCATFIHPNKMGGFAADEAEATYSISFDKDKNKLVPGAGTVVAYSEKAVKNESQYEIKFGFINVGNESESWQTIRNEDNQGYIANIEPIHGMKSISFKFYGYGEVPILRVIWGYKYVNYAEMTEDPEHFVDLQGDVKSTTFNNSMPNYFWICNKSVQSTEGNDLLCIKTMTITYDCADHTPASE